MRTLNQTIMKTKPSFIVMLLISISSFGQTNQNPRTISSLEQFLAYLPVILFAFILIILFWKLNKESYKIGDALKENTTIEVSEDNPALAEKPKPASTGENDTTPKPAQLATPPPFVPKTIQPKSTSRLIAFISGLVSVGIAASLCSFLMYNYFNGDKNVDLSQLTNVLLSLGIGVIPYAVNKISTAK